MEKITISGELPFGYKDGQGVVHRAFTMRALTLGDMERMQDEWPDLLASENSITRRRLAFACALESLGTLPPKAITPELLEGLPA